VEEFLRAAEELSFKESKLTGIPPIQILTFAVEVGKRLAENLSADIKVVEAGCYLRDCMIGKAIREGRAKEHVEMSHEEGEKLIDEYKLDPKIKKNILACIDEHHGVDNFYSIESEICCNSDCYNFVSLKGFMSSMRYLVLGKDMTFEEFVDFLESKVKEKEKLLTLDIVQTELEPQIEIIKDVLSHLK
jgi:hypothetical protein